MTTRILVTNDDGVSAPGIKALDLPLEKGKKWTTTFNVEGETFTAEVTEDFKVESAEKAARAASALTVTADRVSSG